MPAWAMFFQAPCYRCGVSLSRKPERLEMLFATGISWAVATMHADVQECNLAAVWGGENRGLGIQSVGVVLEMAARHRTYNTGAL